MSARKPLDVPVVVRVPGCRPLEGRTLDIGLDGACVGASHSVESNLLCNVVLVLPDKRLHFRRLELEARVVSSVLTSAHGFKIALNFLSTSAFAREALEEAISPNA